MRNLLWLAAAAVLIVSGVPRAQAETNNAPGPNVPAYKISGSPTAPIALEVYTDYECPHCKVFYDEAIPQYIAEFVKTGKGRLVHRDFPIQSIHPYAGLAAVYANAAGEIGHYQTVVDQLFKTQDNWGQNGNVDGEVMKVLAPGDMQKVRDLVKNDKKVNDTIADDVEMAKVDHLLATPTLVIVYKGKRDVITGGMPWVTLKAYLDDKLKK